ncbi:MAG TPA: FAD-dependent oxidoreductase [Nitrospiria bacterium]|nr:FAD-dependent oxidoreductase [Nitrospiria bacterium]
MAPHGADAEDIARRDADVSSSDAWDAAIIGGGFFGCRLALELKRQGLERVVLVEREADILRRASFANQARVHHGYHYPRSFLTALRSRVNFPKFVEEYPDCIDRGFEHYYAVSTINSLAGISASRFRTFCDRISAPIEPAPAEVRRLFNPGLIEDVFLVQEYAFDAVRLRRALRAQIDRSGVSLALNTDVTAVRRGRDGRMELTLERGGRSGALLAERVLNCTFARANRLLRNSGLPTLPLRYELAELALVEPPDALRRRAITVVCGPFFSIMPFPARGLHSLSHVRYTPHVAWTDGPDAPPDGPPSPARLGRASRYTHMVADAARFVPVLRECRHVDSLWEIKTALPSSKSDDSRPIVIASTPGLPNFHSIVGAKIDQVYDLLSELDLMAASGGRA